jgi:ankyrin repeat protein
MPCACWFTPLMHTLRYLQPRWEMASLLLENNIAINAVNGLGASALHIIILQGTNEAAQWLLDHGANINQIDEEFCSTLLGSAARWGKSDMLKLLLRCGADNKKAGAEWATSMAWAISKGHHKVVIYQAKAQSGTVYNLTFIYNDLFQLRPHDSCDLPYVPRLLF